MQKCKLMPDVEQFGSRLDTMGADRRLVQNMQIQWTTAGPTKTI